MKTRVRIAMAVAMILAALFGIAQAEPVKTKAAEYLEAYYSIAPFSLEESKPEEINEALKALGGNALKDGEMSYEAIVAEGIRIAGLEELARALENEVDSDKAAEILRQNGVNVENEAYDSYIAAAYMLELITGKAEDKEDIETFLYRCVEIGGGGRHYIGRVSDDTILSGMKTALDEIMIFDEAELSELGGQIVLNGLTTGYSLKYNQYDPRFLADYTLRYGHGEYKHAIQLVGLLKNLGLDGYIQIEPKVSVYEYKPEWGPPPETTPTYTVKEVAEGRYLCYAVEYDLNIEFDTREDKEAFYNIIDDYATKYRDRVDQEGNVTAKILAGSWWQPLFLSMTPMEEGKYGELVDNIVYSRTALFSIHSYSVPEKSEEIIRMISQINPALPCSSVVVYANRAFMGYITGTEN